MGISWTGQPRADRGVNYMVIFFKFFFSFFKYRGTGVLSFAFDFCYRSKVFSSETLFFFIVMVVTYNTIVFRLRDLRLQLGFCLLQLFMLIKLLCFSRPFISVVWPKSTNDFEPLRRVTHRPFAQKRRSPPVKNVYKKRGTVEKENGHNTKKKRRTEMDKRRFRRGKNILKWRWKRYGNTRNHNPSYWKHKEKYPDGGKKEYEEEDQWRT